MILRSDLPNTGFFNSPGDQCLSHDVTLPPFKRDGPGRHEASRNNGRSRTPTTMPTAAAAIQTQPCRLPEAIPEKNAPMLQP